MGGDSCDHWPRPPHRRGLDGGRDAGPVGAISARYDRRVVITLDNGLEIAFPPRLAEALSHATPAEVAVIEISPLGDGLHWPALDDDSSVRGLLAGLFGSKRWIAAKLGIAGGPARSEAKAATSREEGRKGGRPRKAATARRPTVPIADKRSETRRRTSNPDDTN